MKNKGYGISIFHEENNDFWSFLSIENERKTIFGSTVSLKCLLFSKLHWFGWHIRRSTCVLGYYTSHLHSRHILVLLLKPRESCPCCNTFGAQFLLFQDPFLCSLTSRSNVWIRTSLKWFIIHAVQEPFIKDGNQLVNSNPGEGPVSSCITP